MTEQAPLSAQLTAFESKYQINVRDTVRYLASQDPTLAGINADTLRRYVTEEVRPAQEKLDAIISAFSLPENNVKDKLGRLFVRGYIPSETTFSSDIRVYEARMQYGHNDVVEAVEKQTGVKLTRGKLQHYVTSGTMPNDQIYYAVRAVIGWGSLQVPDWAKEHAQKMLRDGTPQEITPQVAMQPTVSVAAQGSLTELVEAYRALDTLFTRTLEVLGVPAEPGMRLAKYATKTAEGMADYIDVLTQHLTDALGLMEQSEPLRLALQQHLPRETIGHIESLLEAIHAMPDEFKASAAIGRDIQPKRRK